MEIRDNSIIVDEKQIDFGMSFSEVSRILQPYIFAQAENYGQGLSHLLINKQDFYGFRGNAAFYFHEGILVKIGMTIDWGMYYLLDEKGNKPSIYVAVKAIRRSCENKLSQYFELDRRSTASNQLFKKDSILVLSSVSRFNDDYSISIQKEESIK